MLFRSFANEVQICDVTNLLGLKVEMEILTSRRENFRNKLETLDSEFKEYIDSKELDDDLQTEIFKEWHHDVTESVNRIESVWNKNIEGKKKAFTKDKIFLSKNQCKSQNNDSETEEMDSNYNEPRYESHKHYRNDDKRNHSNQQKNSKTQYHRHYKERNNHQRSKGESIKATKTIATATKTHLHK